VGSDRKKIVERYSKLLQRARDKSSPAEAEVAMRAAQKLAAEHHLTQAELTAGQMGAAFDDLVLALQKFVENHPSIPAGLFNTSQIVTDVLAIIRSMSDCDKSTKLQQMTKLIRGASLIAGGNATVRGARAALETALSNHGLTI
jgi:hypothetical protein